MILTKGEFIDVAFIGGTKQEFYVLSKTDNSYKQLWVFKSENESVVTICDNELGLHPIAVLNFNNILYLEKRY